MKHGKLTRRLQRKVRRVISGGTTRLLKPLIKAESAQDEMPASPDESSNVPVSDNPVANNYDGGVLRLGKSSHLPTALAEASEHNEHGWLPSALVITITLMAILFIAIITWFISRMPGK